MAISIADPVARDVRLPSRATAFLLLDGLRRPRQAKPQDVVLCALGLDRDGNPRPLALRVVAREGEQAWLALLRSLKSSGVGPDLLLISCDGHPALIRAIQSVFPSTPVQISIAHRLLALALKVDLEWRAPCLADARAIFSAPDRETAVARFREWRTNWLKAGYRAVSSLESDLAPCLTFYRFPQTLWPKIRTVNLVERVFREARQAVLAPSENLEPAPEEPVAAVPALADGVLAPPMPAVVPEPARPAAPTVATLAIQLSQRASHGRLQVPTNGDRRPAPAHVRDLTADADFMLWLNRQRQHADVQAPDLALAAAAVLAGLLVGLVLIGFL